MAADRSGGDLGSRLRAARERRGVSLRQISAATKISVSALEALERNEISKLPGGIFSRAFVRSYAAEVGLDPDEAIQDFLAQLPRDVPVPHRAPAESAEDHDAIESDRRTASTFLRLTMISIPLAAAVVYFGTAGRPTHTSHGVEPPAAQTQPETAPPPPRAAEPVPPRPKAVEPAAETRSPAPPSKQPTATSLVKPTVATVPERPAPQPALTDAREDEPAHLTIELTVTAPCWMRATADGEKKLERLLQPGERQTIEVARELSLTAGDASAVKMTINGAAARPLGRKNEVITARINRTNFRTYLPSR
jgi:cytoskeleton protein RodZ